MPGELRVLNNDTATVQISGNYSPEAPPTKHLENGKYLLDEVEHQTYTVAGRMVERVAHHELDLTEPLAEFDYLLLMCAQLIIAGEENVDETLSRIVNECLEERRRHAC